MSGGKPTLGYPSRTAAVQGMRAEGLATRTIARRIGIDTSTVRALEASAGRADRRAEPVARGARGARGGIGEVAVILPVDIVRALRPHAARRGIAVDTLARRILDAALDGMVDGVLDDAAELRERAA